jgi:O-antigen ligase
MMMLAERLASSGQGFLRRYGRTLLQLAIIGSVLLISLLLGYRPPISPMLLAAGLGGLLLMLFAAHSMSSALTVLIATSAIVNFGLSTGTQSPVHISLLMVMLFTGVWVLKMLLERRLRLVPTPANLPLLLFNAALLISWIAGYVFWKPTAPRPDNAFVVQAGQVAMFVLSTAAFLLTANHPLQKKDLKRWNVIIIAIGIIAVLWELFQILTTGSSQRPEGFNGAMTMWPFVLLWAQLLFNTKIPTRLRIVGWLSLPLWLYWALVRYINWKSGWIPALLSLTVLLWMRSRRLFLILLVVVSIFVALNWNAVISAGFTSETQSGSLLRPPIWYDVLRLASHSPILGLGPANYMYYWRDPTFVSYSLDLTNWWAWYQIGYSPPSHNMYVDVIAQTGVVGFVLFIWAIIALVWLTYRARRSLPPGFLGAYVQGIFAGFLSLLFASFVFADWLIPFVYNITIRGFQHSVYSWLLLGTIIPLLKRNGSDGQS